VLSKVNCIANEGVDITYLEDGISLVCLGEGGGANCTFVNVPIPTIQTLSEWGMVAAAIGLEFVGLFFAVRRERLQASA
jgi:hypothetical protein